MSDLVERLLTMMIASSEHDCHTLSQAVRRIEALELALAPFAAYAPFLAHRADDENILAGHVVKLKWVFLLAWHFRAAARLADENKEDENKEGLT